IKLRVALQHGIEALNGGDDDLGGRVDRIGLEALNRIERRELPGIVGRGEIGELVFGLLAEVGTVHEEQNAFRSAELEQAISGVDGSEGLAGTGSHLDEGAGTGCGEGCVETAYGLFLDLPKTGSIYRRQLLEAGAELTGLLQPRSEGFRAWKTEDLPASRLGVEPVGEVGHRTVRLEQEWQRPPTRRKIIGEANC